jgi:hypothetical protein
VRKLLLALYPFAWRERYGEEMSALLADSPPSLAATLDLARGAVRAHLHPLAGTQRAERARSCVVGVLGCFIAFCFLGAGFAKTTENFDYAGHRHPVLGATHNVVWVAALVAGGALLLAAAPLLLATLAEARRTRSVALAKLIAIPPLAVAALIASLGLLVIWLDAGHRHHVGVVGWLLFVLCQLAAIGSGYACWVSPRAILRRVEMPRHAYELSLPALGVVAISMAVITLATGLYLICVVLDASRLGASANGPGQLIDVTTSIAILLAGMVFLSAAALVSARRGLLAMRAL